MRSLRITPIIVTCLLLCACGKIFQNPLDYFTGGGGDDDQAPSATPSRVSDAAGKYAIAIGGVAPGRDEIIIEDSSGNPLDFSGKVLACTADDDIVTLSPRAGFSTEAAGSGVRVIAVEPGVTAVRCTLDGTALSNIYEVTVPPQHLIQILVAEASAQLAGEATTEEVDGETLVALTSVSATGNALGSAIRNRIVLINSKKDPTLFGATQSAYDANPPSSYYEAVIMAAGQFSPTAVDDPNHQDFNNAEDRNFLDDDTKVAYDQAVITAAGIFNGDIDDSAGSAFAFRSPSAAEWGAIMGAWTTSSLVLPDSAGFSDSTFPALSPIQILIVPDTWRYRDGTNRPAFVFARQRTSSDPAVSNTP